MEIKKVELITVDKKTQREAGMFIPPSLRVTWENGDVNSVPDDPLNADYQRAAVWYEKQKTKPFEYKFKQTKDLTAENANDAPVPLQKPTEAKPDAAAAGPNLTQKQIREIEKEQADSVKRGSAGKANLER